jgi:hypothetical protein
MTLDLIEMFFFSSLTVPSSPLLSYHSALSDLPSAFCRHGQIQPVIFPMGVL